MDHDDEDPPVDPLIAMRADLDPSTRDGGHGAFRRLCHDLLTALGLEGEAHERVFRWGCQNHRYIRRQAPVPIPIWCIAAFLLIDAGGDGIEIEQYEGEDGVRWRRVHYPRAVLRATRLSPPLARGCGRLAAEMFG